MNLYPCVCIGYAGVFFMLCRRKPSGVRRRLRRYICFLLITAILFTVYFEVAVRVQLCEVIRTQMRAVAEQAVCEAVSAFLQDNADAGDRLSQLQLTDGGTVAAVATDSSYINYVKTEISRRSQEQIDLLSHSGSVAAPLGSFTGLILLNNIGPEIPLRIDSRQSVMCTFRSTFESAGINQTVHHIALIVDVEIAVYNPFRIYSGISVSSDFEIAQTVIVGSVPSYGGVVTY